MKTLILIITLALAYVQPSHACSNDMQCGLGAQCLRAAGSFDQFNGICVHSDVITATTPEPNVHAVHACNSQFDCAYGDSCIKSNNQWVGICVH